MVTRKCKRIAMIVSVLILFGCPAHAQTLTISNVSPTSGPVGMPVTITGLNFGAAQGSSTVSLNSVNLTVTSWSDTAIVALVPSGTSSGPFSVTVNGETVTSPSFTITSLPSGWSDQDIGSVGKAGSASYASGVFTVAGAGQSISGSADTNHFAYEPLSGDGTIVARVVSVQGTTTANVGVMIRETLSPGATMAFVDDYDAQGTSHQYFYYRSTTGAGAQSTSLGADLKLPAWLKLVRSGNTFTPYFSPDGLNWTSGTSQTITMAQNVYIGLAVESGSTSTLATAQFDSVSVSSSAAPAPVITSASATTGSVGSQITITGTGFGSSEGSSVVTLNDALMTIDSWSDTSLVVTIPSGATSGPLVVSVGPGMNDSNPVVFTVTSQPLPSGLLDQDVGSVGTAGSATYANGVFTVAGAGQSISGSADAIHFAYEPLSGDGTIVARVVSVQGTTTANVGVMIRETLSSGARLAFVDYYAASYSYQYFYYRTTTGASTQSESLTSGGKLAYWLKLVRSGNTFTPYFSPDGLNWSTGTSQTITMAQNVYIGLAVESGSTSTLATAKFDCVSISSTASPAPVITSVSGTTGSVGNQIQITGTGFGSSEGSSVVTLNDALMTIDSWSDTSLVVTIPSGATSGPLMVSVGPGMNDSNPVVFTVTSQPLPSGVLDQDVGSVGTAGSATYANGVFSVTGGGQSISGSTDAIHFAYEPLSGDGTIVARVVSVQGTTTANVGVMIRETLSTGARLAFVDDYDAQGSSYQYLYYRATTGGSAQSTSLGGGLKLPAWVKLVRSGNTFTAYVSPDGVNWTGGTSETITMAQNVYIGLAVESGSTSTLATATFDSVSISSTASPAPAITSASATTGSVGSQVAITGTGFGASQGASTVLLNDAAVTINSWSSSSIVVTIPSGATSGPLVVSVAPGMNDSNPVVFAVTADPLPAGWLDQDVGQVVQTGSASWSNGVFTINGAGSTTNGSNSEGMHIVYQPLPGDGSIVARVVSLQGSSAANAGVIIRETLNPGATMAYMQCSGNGQSYFVYRLAQLPSTQRAAT